MSAAFYFPKNRKRFSTFRAFVLFILACPTPCSSCSSSPSGFNSRKMAGLACRPMSSRIGSVAHSAAISIIAFPLRPILRLRKMATSARIFDALSGRQELIAVPQFAARSLRKRVFSSRKLVRVVLALNRFSFRSTRHTNFPNNRRCSLPGIGSSFHG